MKPFVHASLSLALLGSLAAAPLPAQIGELGAAEPGPVSARPVWSADAARPGDFVVLAVVVDIDQGWHLNADAAQVTPLPGFDPIATELRLVDVPQDIVTLERVAYPPAHFLPVGFAEGDVAAWEGQVVLYLPVKVSARAQPGQDLVFQLGLYYQTCDDSTCLPPVVLPIVARLPVVEAAAAVQPVAPELFEAWKSRAPAVPAAVGFDLFGLRFSVDASSSLGLLALLLVAMVGGALLNFTPCVLPVIPIKIISLSKVAGDRARCLALGASMSVGVIAFWLGLGLLISAVSGFTATNQLFQYPAFTIGVGVVIAALAVGMCGLFSVRLPGFVYGITPSQETLAGSFGLGIMTAILSTPCTAPFMGAAAAWAAGQTAAITLSTFVAIGIGMALPYFVLSAMPGLVQKMPRSGPASQLIKEVMGLLLLAAAAYFIGTGLSGLLVSPPDPPSKLHWWPVMALVAAAGLWLAYRTLRITASPIRRALFGGLGLAIVAAAALGASAVTAKGPIDWVYYTDARFEELAPDNVIVMDFTAEWCLNCKALEHAVLHREDVAAILASEGVVPMKVDITGNNPQGKQRLADAGSLTIPLLVVYAPDKREVFKSDAYTAAQVIEAIKEARTKG